MNGFTISAQNFTIGSDTKKVSFHGPNERIGWLLQVNYVTGLTFTDVNGSPLDLSYTTQSGLTYPMPQSGGVPEPATLALLGIGLAGLCFSRRHNLN